MSTIARSIRAESPAFPASVQVRSLRGRERISRPYELELEIITDDLGGIDESTLLDQGLKIVFEGDDGDLRTIHGMAREVHDLGLTEANHVAYRIHVVPRMWRLMLAETLDIFLDTSVPDIAKARLGRHMLFAAEEGKQTTAQGDPPDLELRLARTYEAREFVVQYKETDFAFLNRLCEHLGIFYFFEERPDRELLVLGDDNESFGWVDADKGPLPWAGRGEKRGVFELGARTKPIPHRFVTRDYNYRTPQLDMLGQAELTAPGPGLDRVEYGTHFKTPDEAKFFAEVRAQEARAQRKVYEGRSADPRMRAGARFRLEGHPRGDLELLVTEVEHTADLVAFNQGDENRYECSFKAIEASIAYRPPRETTIPRISGVLTGKVVADGDYADVDDQGRYRVRFLFDTAERGEEQASRPIRMMQPHSGPGYGMHFPLRGGVEVALSFVDGDPDRPIIAGTVPNPSTASPITDENKRRNILRTGRGNELNIDDDDNSPRIKMSTPRLNSYLQLGAPNGAEDGAMLSTAGSATTIGTLGVGMVGSIGTSVSLIQDLRSSGDIITLAEKPGFIEKALTAGALLDTVVALGTAAVEIKRTTLSAAAMSTAKISEAADKTVAAKNDGVAVQKAKQNDAMEALGESPPATDTSPKAEARRELDAAYAAYQAVTKRLTDERKAALDARTRVEELERRRDIGGETDLGGQLDAARALRDDAERAVLLSTEEIDGDEVAPTDKLWAGISEVKKAASLTPDKLTELQAKATAFAALGTPAEKAQMDKLKLAVTDETEARRQLYEAEADKETKKRAAEDADFVASKSPVARSLDATVIGLNALRVGLTLYSSILAGIQFLQNTKQGATNEVAWQQLRTDLGLMGMRGFTGFGPLANEAVFQDNASAMHLIGSEDSTGVYALDRLFMWSKSINVHGSEQIVIACGKDNAAITESAATKQAKIAKAATAPPTPAPPIMPPKAPKVKPPRTAVVQITGALVLSEQKAELQAPTVYLTGEKLDIRTAAYVPPAPSAPPVTKKQTLLMDQSTNTIALEAANSATAKTSFTLLGEASPKAELLTVKGAKKTALTAIDGTTTVETTDGIKLATTKSAADLEFDAMGKATVLVSGGSRVWIKTDKGTEIDVGKNSEVRIKAGSSEITMGASGVKIKGTKVEIEGMLKVNGQSLAEITAGTVKLG